jgi:hypothetical protein
MTFAATACGAVRDGATTPAHPPGLGVLVPGTAGVGPR